ncbi:MAG: hypothetical protein WDW38_002548 [Sanguina aurantia]
MVYGTDPTMSTDREDTAAVRRSVAGHRLSRRYGDADLSLYAELGGHCAWVRLRIALEGKAAVDRRTREELSQDAPTSSEEHGDESSGQEDGEDAEDADVGGQDGGRVRDVYRRVRGSRVLVLTGLGNFKHGDDPILDPLLADLRQAGLVLEHIEFEQKKGKAKALARKLSEGRYLACIIPNLVSSTLAAGFVGEKVRNDTAHLPLQHARKNPGCTRDTRGDASETTPAAVAPGVLRHSVPDAQPRRRCHSPRFVGLHAVSDSPPRPPMQGAGTSFVPGNPTSPFQDGPWRQQLTGWVKAGGVVLMHGEKAAAAVLSTWFGLSWRCGEYFRAQYQLNEGCHAQASWAGPLAALPKGYNVEACTLVDVPAAECVYGTAAGAVRQSMGFAPTPVEVQHCSVAVAHHEAGVVGFWGDVNCERDTHTVVVGLLLHLLADQRARGFGANMPC